MSDEKFSDYLKRAGHTAQRASALWREAMVVMMLIVGAVSLLVLIAIGLKHWADNMMQHETEHSRDLQVLVHDRALLAAKALGEPGARDLTKAEIADARERCARRPEYVAVCTSIEEHLIKDRK